ncbi:adenosylcobinamide-GDP ribazoletransferase [Spirochaetia bacterium]|nr:adenosylcobinamide-GDP ribazoletransferase [Spirochaetia bacterium]
MNKFLSVLSLSCRVPIKAPAHFDASRIDLFFPIIGLFPALLVSGVFALAFIATKEAAISVIVTLIAQYLCFNLFHLDGLADTADAFLGTVSKERRLEILKDSRIGVYGLFAALSVLGLKAALLAVLLGSPSLNPRALFIDMLLLAAYPLSGRFAGALIPCISKPARPGGLGALAKDSMLRYAIAGFVFAACIWGLLITALVTLSPSSLPQTVYASLIALCAGPVSAVFIARLYTKQVGGYSGDALGCAVEIAELLHLCIITIVVR